MITIDRQGLKVIRTLEGLKDKSKKGAQRGLWYVGREATKIAQKEIKDKSKKTGRFYRFKNRTIRSSAPGEYPANRSGNLRKSLVWEVIDSQTMETGSKLSKKYPAFLELGTTKMKRRSYLERTADDNIVKFKNIILEEITKEVKKI